MKRVPVTIALILVLCLVLPAWGCDSGTGEPETAADFFKGKTINLIVSNKPGATSDLSARAMASYLERDTGASVVVTNEKGAGGLEGMNHVYRAEPDGLTLGVVSLGKLVSNKVLDEPAAVYNLEDFSYLLNMGGAPYFFLVSAEGNTTMDEFRACEDCIIGACSPAGFQCLGGVTVIEILDLDAQVVTGVEKTADLALMTARGEIVGYVSNPSSSKSYIESGLVEPLFMLATERSTVMPDTPAVGEIIGLTGGDLALIELWEQDMALSIVLAAPPGLPADRKEFLDGIVKGWIEEEGFCDEMSLIMGYEEIEYKIGNKITRAMRDLVENLDEFRAVFAEMIEKYRA